MDEKRGKWIDYFDLKDAMKGPGCPLCSRMEALSLRFLDSLFYERVTDVGTRVNLAKAKGFCNWHAWMSTELPHSNSGIAIIYKDLLDMEIGRLAKWVEKSGDARKSPLGRRRRGRSIREGVVFSWREKAACPICRQIRSHERMDMGTLLDFIDEEAFSRAFDESSGICLRHLLATLEHFDTHPHLPLLVEKQLKKYQSLSDELAEFIRKLDYRFSKEPKGPEGDSWKRVIEQFVGHREIFGNEVHLGSNEPLP